jgi:heat shock protein HslJ
VPPCSWPHSPAAGATTPSGPAPTTSGAGDDLEGSWALESYALDGDEVAAAEPAATITFAADGSFQGTSPCNAMSGTWGGEGGTLTLELGPMTQMACVDPDLQAQETAFTGGLPEVTGATVDGDALVLTGDAVTFRFARGPEGIVGAYQVTGVNDGAGAVESNAATEAITVDFGDGGTASGNDGCNAWGAPYVVDGTSLTVGPEFGGTTKACDDVRAVAARFKRALLSVVTWERDGQVVTLRDADGATQLTLVTAG